MKTIEKVATIEWKNNKLRMVDQTKLPLETVFLDCDQVEQVWEAIKRLSVRGAPAIGIAGAYGLYIGVAQSQAKTFDAFNKEVEKVGEYLIGARPTAVNLAWAVKRIQDLVQQCQSDSVETIKEKMLQEAHTILEEDRQMCRQIGEHAAELFEDGSGVLTHCNAGGLATAEYGTALAGIFRAHELGKKLHVFADETRPLLQGARLTTWELMQAGIDVTLICDNMAAHVMKEGKIQAVVVGADRVAANGDAANKIGTYSVALAAKAHNIPFYVAIPTSTLDLEAKTGADIPIEQRIDEEVTEGFGRRTAPEGVQVYNPAFDVTPHELIEAIITEKGIIRPPFEANLKNLKS